MNCPVGTGTLPNAAGACAKLSGLDISAFAPSSDRLACAMVFSGPEQALVEGIFDGQPLTASFSRNDSCHTNDWARLTFLFAGYGRGS